MSDFLALDTADGRYACGAIGELVDGPAEVTLLASPPRGESLAVRFRPGGLEASDREGVTIARARAIMAST